MTVDEVIDQYAERIYRWQHEDEGESPLKLTTGSQREAVIIANYCRQNFMPKVSIERKEKVGRMLGDGEYMIEETWRVVIER